MGKQCRQIRELGIEPGPWVHERTIPVHGDKVRRIASAAQPQLCDPDPNQREWQNDK
jgi:hypothetical protein